MNRYRFQCRQCGTTARPLGESELAALLLLREFDWLIVPDPAPDIPLESYEVLCPVCRPGGDPSI